MSNSIIHAKTTQSEITLILYEEFKLAVEIDADLLNTAAKGRVVTLTFSYKTAIEMMLILTGVYGMTPGEIAPVLNKEHIEKLRAIADLETSGNVNELAAKWLTEKLDSL